jgi:hypothetical protein
MAVNYGQDGVGTLKDGTNIGRALSPGWRRKAAFTSLSLMLELAPNWRSKTTPVLVGQLRIDSKFHVGRFC